MKKLTAKIGESAVRNSYANKHRVYRMKIENLYQMKYFWILDLLYTRYVIVTGKILLLIICNMAGMNKDEQL